EKPAEPAGLQGWENRRSPPDSRVGKTGGARRTPGLEKPAEPAGLQGWKNRRSPSDSRVGKTGGARRTPGLEKPAEPVGLQGWKNRRSPPDSRVGKQRSVPSEKSEVKNPSPWSPAGSAGFLLAIQSTVVKRTATSPRAYSFSIHKMGAARDCRTTPFIKRHRVLSQRLLLFWGCTHLYAHIGFAEFADQITQRFDVRCIGRLLGLHGVDQHFVQHA
ncbi:MAG: hypothetical protein ACI856_000979, partial [Kiritimatiellia bacterium]